MADPIPYPMIGGRRYSWASIVVNVGSRQFIGVKSINYSDKLDPTTISGTGQNIIGGTAGKYSAEGDIEFYQEEADALIAALGMGWGNRGIKIQVQYIDDFQPTQTHKLLVRLVGMSNGGSEGSEAFTNKFTMFFQDSIDRNGVRLVPPINAAALGGSVLA